MHIWHNNKYKKINVTFLYVCSVFIYFINFSDSILQKNIHLKISTTSFGNISLYNITVAVFKNNSFSNSSGTKSGLAIP